MGAIVVWAGSGVKMGELRDQGWDSWSDQPICQTEERGAFHALRGKGKSLDLASNPHAGDQELAFPILKEAGFAAGRIEGRLP